MHVFLDLWGVLIDIRKTDRAYNRRAASILASRYGGGVKTWLKAYNSAWRNYQSRLEEADWSRHEWFTVVDRLDKNLILETFGVAGVESVPRDVLSFSRNLENEVMSCVAAFYPGAEGAVRRLHEAGHKVYLATQAGEWHARGALKRSGFANEFDGIFSGSSQNSSKDQKLYWARVLRSVDAPASSCVSVDDRTDCLKAAASVGFTAVLLERGERGKSRKLLSSIYSSLHSLRSLPRLLDQLTAGKSQSRRVRPEKV